MWSVVKVETEIEGEEHSEEQSECEEAEDVLLELDYNDPQEDFVRF